MSEKIYPRSGQVYTLAEITKLYLRDQPFLQFFHNGELCVIQGASLSEEELCASNPEAAKTKWRYVRETEEWIPLFRYSDENELPITAFVTIEPSNSHEGEYWVCWMGYYQQQDLHEGPKYTKDPSGPIPAPIKEETVVAQPIPAIDPVIIQAFAQAAMDFAQDPAKAAVYVANRQEDAEELKASLKWDGYIGNTLFASLYATHAAVQTPNEESWGYVFRMGATSSPDEPSKIVFPTEECFVAYVLAKFW